MAELLLVLKEAGMVFPIILHFRQQRAVLVYWSSSFVQRTWHKPAYLQLKIIFPR